MKYDYLIVGAGIFGATFANIAAKHGNKCLVIDKDDHVAGHIHTKRIEDIDVHVYGAHIFHTSNTRVWDYVNQFVTFNRYTNAPIANFKGELYNLPFNMNTFYQMWGTRTPQEAQEMIARQQAEGVATPRNLEEQAIRLVGRDIYEKLIEGYTEKQWGRKCSELPAFIIQRLPVRFTFDNNYFNDLYQGIPNEGYDALVEGLLEGVEVRLNTDYFVHKEELDAEAAQVLYTGPIDAYYDYRFGHLAYRSLRFETEVLEMENYQGNAVVNYTDAQTPYTRIIEHKHFTFGSQPKTVITREYSMEWQPGDEPYYPVNDDKNQVVYEQYRALANAETNVLFGGRLAEYKYYNMDQVVASALALADRVFGEE